MISIEVIHMMWNGWNMMGFFGWTMMILFWGAVVVLIVWAVRSAGLPRNSTGSDALGILERRFAAGEIDTDEFEERKRILGAARWSNS